MKKVVLLAGQTGSGLTTLFNTITNSNLKTAYGGKTVTLEVSVKDSQYGQGFTLIDTPGFGFGYDINVNTIPTYLNLLENIEISRIMIVSRSDIIQSCKDILQVFQRYKDKITIVITFFDLIDSDEKENIKNDIIQDFRKFGIQSLIFTSKQDSGEQLCKLFDKEIKYSLPQKIQFPETEMLSLLKIDDLEYLEIWFKQLKLLAPYRQTFWKLGEVKIDNENQDEFLMALKYLIKKIINESQKVFSAQYIYHKKEDEQSLLYYTYKFFLTKELNTQIAYLKQHKIELQNFMENELRSFDKKYEAGFQICLQKIRDEAKKKKINYL